MAARAVDAVRRLAFVWLSFLAAWGCDRGGPAALPDSGSDAGPGLAVAVSCGAGTCAITDKGALKCWGPNTKGCGDECLPPGFPSQVIGMESGVVSVAVDVFHACAALEDGSVWCWGNSVDGVLGNSCGSDHCSEPLPVKDLVALSEAVALGADTSCALAADEAVQCWGCVGLGCGQPPTLVDGWHSGIRELEASPWYALGITDAGGLEAWQMSCPNLEPTEDCPGPPVAVDGLLGPVVDAAGSSVSTCALLETGRIMCWGNNQFGYLGDGTTEDREQPTPVIGLDDVVIVKVSMNSRPTCALTEDGRAFCWGDNRTGAIGNGTLSQREPTPSEVIDLPESITAISAGGEHACAIGESGAIYCWGNNMDGQLGNGEDERDECYEVEDYPNCYHPTPVRVVGFGPEPAEGWPEPPEE